MRIGKFGIGFKSVYAYTISPQIHSKGVFNGKTFEEHFEIKNRIQPSPISNREIVKPYINIFILPFNKTDMPQETSFAQISEELQNIDPCTLLFLRNIVNIRCKVEQEFEKQYHRDVEPRDCCKKVTITISSEYDDERKDNFDWLVFEKPVPKYNPPDPIYVEIAFKIEQDDETEKEYIENINESRLIAFFETKVETNLGLLIQGPYKTTTARDSIKDPKYNELNQELIILTAELISESLENIKNMGMLTIDVLEALPINCDSFNQKNEFRPIYERIFQSFKNQCIIPTSDYQFAKN